MEKRRCFFRSIVKELLNAAIQLLNAYYKSSTGIEKYVNYIKVKSFRNCLEDITLINNETQNITFNDICNNFADIKYFCSQLCATVDNYTKTNKNYLASLDNYLENEYMS